MAAPEYAAGVQAAIQKYGLGFPVSCRCRARARAPRQPRPALTRARLSAPPAAAQAPLAERGCERTHWRTLPSEDLRSKLPAAGACGGGAGAPARPQARRSAPSRVQLSDFELGSVLGEGNYSRVFLATLKSTGEQMAVKMIEKKKVERFKKQAEPLMEKHVLSVTSHPFIVRLLHTFHDSMNLYIVTEHVPGGELWNLAHKAGLRHSLAAFYAAELLDALEYLHANNVRARQGARAALGGRRGPNSPRPRAAPVSRLTSSRCPSLTATLAGQIVHRDVKPENVLIAASGHIKLIDFGTAKTLGPGPRDTAGNFQFGQVHAARAVKRQRARRVCAARASGARADTAPRLAPSPFHPAPCSRTRTRARRGALRILKNLWARRNTCRPRRSTTSRPTSARTSGRSAARSTT